MLACALPSPPFTIESGEKHHATYDQCGYSCCLTECLLLCSGLCLHQPAIAGLGWRAVGPPISGQQANRLFNQLPLNARQTHHYCPPVHLYCPISTTPGSKLRAMPCTHNPLQVRRVIGLSRLDENESLFAEASALADILGEVQLNTKELLARHSLCRNVQRSMVRGWRGCWAVMVDLDCMLCVLLVLCSKHHGIHRQQRRPMSILYGWTS